MALQIRAIAFVIYVVISKNTSIYIHTSPKIYTQAQPLQHEFEPCPKISIFKKPFKTMTIVAIIAIAVLIFGIGFYNSLINKKNQVANAFSAIDVMLKKRFDLIPNLVEIVKQYTSYEGDTLTKITELRGKALGNNATEGDKLALDQQIGSAVKGLMVSVENYPDLKANTNFLNLQNTWTESEEQIAAARRTYNSSVTSYNNAVLMFPGNMFAGMLGYQTMPVLASTEEERRNVNAKELFNS